MCEYCERAKHIEELEKEIRKCNKCGNTEKLWVQNKTEEILCEKCFIEMIQGGLQ